MHCTVNVTSLTMGWNLQVLIFHSKHINTTYSVISEVPEKKKNLYDTGDVPDFKISEGR